MSVDSSYTVEYKPCFDGSHLYELVVDPIWHMDEFDLSTFELVIFKSKYEQNNSPRTHTRLPCSLPRFATMQKAREYIYLICNVETQLCHADTTYYTFTPLQASEGYSIAISDPHTGLAEWLFEIYHPSIYDTPPDNTRSYGRHP